MNESNGPEAVVLLGAPRSGTSLLYRALCLHPDAAWISNWQRRAPGLAPLSALNRLAGAAPGMRARVWFGSDRANAYRYNVSRSVLERLFPQPVEGEPFFTRAGIAATPAAGPPDRVAARALATALQGVVRWSGGRRLVLKRIANNVRIPLLDVALPDARFVHLVRDGRAVAASLVKVDWWPTSQVWWYGGTPQDWEREGRDPWELAARHWVEEERIITEHLAAIDPARVLTLRYEDVLADPQARIGEVAAFGGFDREEPRWTSAVAELRFPGANDGWRATVPESAQQTIERVQRALLEREGYLR